MVGIRPDRRHEFRASLGSAPASEVEFAKALGYESLPVSTVGVESPPFRVTVSKPDEMEPGVTAIRPRRRRAGRGRDVAEFNAGFGMIVALDHVGEVVWQCRGDARIGDFEKLHNGNLIFVTADYRLIEIDWLGQSVNQWYEAGPPEGPTEGVAMDTQTFHREIDQMPSGNILLLSREWMGIDNYYTDGYDQHAPRKRQEVMGDVILGFEHATGEIAWE